MTTTINTFPNNPFTTPSFTPNFTAPPVNPFQPPTPQYEQKTYEDLKARIAELEAKLAEKNSSEYEELDKKLAETEEGCKLLRVKYDGVTKILYEWAMTNPMISPKLTTFSKEWKEKAEEYLKR